MRMNDVTFRQRITAAGLAGNASFLTSERMLLDANWKDEERLSHLVEFLHVKARKPPQILLRIVSVRPIIDPTYQSYSTTTR
jgi:hypothetical protein